MMRLSFLDFETVSYVAQASLVLSVVVAGYELLLLPYVPSARIGSVGHHHSLIIDLLPLACWVCNV